ncbi:hypothetical protein GCM10010300_86530 [Streptomyces olivaceoviridis]|nr:hypothetical protein GCM10010300_86530 [Streptomyces olivaceoviridis]
MWVRIGDKIFTADTIKGMDDSEPRYLQVKVTGEREPLKIRARVPYRNEGLADEERRRYSDSTLPAVVAQGLLDAVAACAVDGGHWLLSFEDNSAYTEVSWVRSELGRTGPPPRRGECVGPRTTPPARRGQGLDERERQRLLAQAPAHWRVPGQTSVGEQEATT